jgi:hypothetical protein
MRKFVQGHIAQGVQEQGKWILSSFEAPMLINFNHFSQRLSGINKQSKT